MRGAPLVVYTAGTLIAVASAAVVLAQLIAGARPTTFTAVTMTVCTIVWALTALRATWRQVRLEEDMMIMRKFMSIVAPPAMPPAD
jgi:hypothetical protein